MMPVAQLDPASLTIWYDPEHVHGGANSDELSEAVNHAMNGDDDDAVGPVLSIEDEGDRVHGINLVSAVWHERRHFLDLLLTNYGSFRIRQFIQLYVNWHYWGEFVSSGKPIVCPIDLYLDPVRCEVLGVEQPDEQLLLLAKSVADRKSMHAEDTQIVPTLVGPLNVGGEAQLEALAYHSQFIAVQERFGLEESYLYQKQQHMLDPGQRKYNWANLMYVQSGLASIVDMGDKRAIADFSGLLPLLYAALATRRFGQEQVNGKKGSSGFAAMRLAGLMHYIKDNKIDFKRLKVEQAWQLVNEIAQKLWNRTVLEEMEEDYRRETLFFEQIFKSGAAPDEILKWMTDVHRLRGELLELLATNPSSILDPIEFSAELLPKLEPIVINTQKSGVLGKVPAPFERVFGYKDPSDNSPDAEWWWAMTSRKRLSDTGTYRFKEFDAALQIVNIHAPFAKLLLNGRRHRTMLGPEILHFEMIMMAQGLRLEFDPLFKFPDEETDPSSVFIRRPDGKAICDICRATVTKDTSLLLSPWVFRYSEEHAEFCIRAYGGGKRGQLKHIRDWSHWLVCRECAAKLGVLN